MTLTLAEITTVIDNIKDINSTSRNDALEDAKVAIERYVRDRDSHFPHVLDTIIPDKWIRVEDRLPEAEQYVTVATGADVWVVPRLYIDGYWYEYGSSCTRQDYTHWQPLPEKPTSL